MINLIVSDMDGTLLTPHGHIAEPTKKAIQYAQGKGTTFMIASGRSLTELHPLLKEAGLKIPVIASNGAQIFDENGQLLAEYAIDKSIAGNLIEHFNREHLYFEVATNKGVFSTDKALRLRHAIEYLNLTQPGYTKAEVLTAAKEHVAKMNLTFIEDFHDLLTDDYTILKMIIMDQRGAEYLTPLAKKIAHNSLTITSSFHTNIEINALKATKGEALKAYTQLKEIDLANTMALGDNNNDLSMLQVVGYPVVMENGNAEAKAVARYITDTNANHGVAKAIAHYLAE